MNTSAISTYSRPENLRQIPDTEFAYICARNQHQAHNLLMKQIKQSGYTQKQIAKITGIDEAALSRLLRRPRNVEINTISKILYAVSGAALGLSPSFPNDRSNWVFRAYLTGKGASTAHPKIVKHDSDARSQKLNSEIIENISSADGKVMELENA